MCVTAAVVGSVSQVDKFLEVWKMPDSGQKTLPLMHKLKSLSGIVEPKRDRADSESVIRHGVRSYTHVNAN